MPLDAVDPVTERRIARLAELVSELTGCTEQGAAEALDVDRHPGVAPPRGDEALGVVARAVTEVAATTITVGGAARRGPGRETGTLRLAGYLRREAGAPVIDLRDDVLPEPSDEFRVARYLDRPRPGRPALVEHGSLRRWERSPVAIEPLS